MLTVDSSVWVNADSPSEPESRHSRALLDRIAANNTTVVVPTLLRIEVAAAISRTRKDPSLARDYSERLDALPFIRWIPVDRSLAARAADLAAEHGLRGADAVFATVAMSHGCELISLDREHLTRLTSVMVVRSPSIALSAWR